MLTPSPLPAVIVLFQTTETILKSNHKLQIALKWCCRNHKLLFIFAHHCWWNHNETCNSNRCSELHYAGVGRLQKGPDLPSSSNWCKDTTNDR